MRDAGVQSPGHGSGRGPVIQPASSDISTVPHSRIAQVKAQ